MRAAVSLSYSNLPAAADVAPLAQSKMPQEVSAAQMCPIGSRVPRCPQVLELHSGNRSG